MQKKAFAGLLPENMLGKVVAETGLDDFGDPHFATDYANFIAAVAEEVELSDMGLAICDEHFRRMLVNRLRIEQAFKEHPEIHDEILAPPLIITGLARTGTTKMQQMISASPDVHALSLWKLLNPAPFPDADPSQEDPRLTFAKAVEDQVRTHYPEMWAAHPTPALNAEEDMLLNDMTFIAPSLPMRLGAANYTRALSLCEPRMYEYTRKLLKYLQWQEGAPDRATKPWILKCPIHLGNLTLVQKIYPGAKIVHCHRALEDSMASTADLSRIAWQMYADKVDKTKIGDLTVDFWALEYERNLQQRPQVDAASLCDVQFTDINKNAIGVIEKIYDFAGLTLSEPARAAMLQWEGENARHKHGKREYNAADYGLSSARVNAAFAAYNAYFKL